MVIDASLQWECAAMGNPKPTYRWLKNGQSLTAEVRHATLWIRFQCDVTVIALPKTYCSLITVNYFCFESLTFPRHSKNWKQIRRIGKRFDRIVISSSDLQRRIHVEAGKLTISRISLLDSGMYQCVAHNEYGSIYASAELKVAGKQIICFVSHEMKWTEDTLYVHCATVK